MKAVNQLIINVSVASLGIAGVSLYDVQVREDKAERKQVTLVRAEEGQDKPRDEEGDVDRRDCNLVLQVLTSGELVDEVRGQTHDDNSRDPLHPLAASEDETDKAVADSYSHCFCLTACDLVALGKGVLGEIWSSWL
jgi:hypothetical protein